MPRSPRHANFKKIITVLAISFGIALGLCGLNLFVVNQQRQGPRTALIITAYVELAVMILSAAGIVLSLIVWGLSSLLNSNRDAQRGPQRLLDDSTDDKPES